MWSHTTVTHNEGHSPGIDAAEKGLFDNTQSLVKLPSLAYTAQTMLIDRMLTPVPPVHESISRTSVLATSANATVADIAAIKPEMPKQNISRWSLLQIWFNMYRTLFIFVTLFNLAAIIMSACGRFFYAENHLGSLVLGNLLCAILMRNEVFLRFLYTIAIYGLQSVRPLSLYQSHRRP